MERVDLGRPEERSEDRGEASDHREETEAFPEALIRRGLPASENTVAFVCGMPAMVTDVREALFGMGVSESRVLLNV